jgi:hypothetical protein
MSWKITAGWSPADADAAAYITAVETADAQALENGVKVAIDNFVLGCKADGIWTAIKASCILAGARTLNGALVPLVGAAPTNVSDLFVSGDYNRKTGLLGNGSTKYLDSNRNNNADPQNSKHVAVYLATLFSSTATAISQFGCGGGATGALSLSVGYNAGLMTYDTGYSSRHNTSTASSQFGSNAHLGLVAINRSIGGSYLQRTGGVNSTVSNSSQTPYNGNIFIAARENGSGVAQFYSSSSLAFYSIGESLDLALLDARVTTLVNAFAAAIP